jgi:hypothetical protein
MPLIVFKLLIYPVNIVIPFLYNLMEGILDVFDYIYNRFVFELLISLLLHAFSPLSGSKRDMKPERGAN